MTALPREPAARGGRALVPTLVFLGTVVAVVSSLGAPLIPTIAATDHVSLARAQWSLTITLLVGAVAAPTMGRMGDGPHRRRVILGSLAVVLAGGVLAALPLGFGGLLGGRALQGVGLGLTPLAIAVACDTLAGERERATIATLSVTTVAGVGLGYPLTGLIAQHLDLHAAFWFGAAVTGLALLLGVLVLPEATDLPARPLDLTGALLLGAGLTAVLLCLSEGESWGWSSPALLSAAVAGPALLAAWGRHELRVPHPLVDLRLAANRGVLTASVTAVCAGAGMYLLLSLVTRFVQTPPSTGYGFGSSVFVAGLVLLPFSVLSVLSSRLATALARRLSVAMVLPIGCLIFLVAMLSFLLLRASLWEVFLTMGLAGLGVGCSFAALPGLIVRAVPPTETGSAISFNQVLRTVGFSIGSAASAAVLAAYTPHGQLLPTAGGYGTAATIGAVLWLATAALTFVLGRYDAAARRAMPAGAGAQPGLVAPRQ